MGDVVENPTNEKALFSGLVLEVFSDLRGVEVVCVAGSTCRLSEVGGFDDGSGAELVVAAVVDAITGLLVEEYPGCGRIAVAVVVLILWD